MKQVCAHPFTQLFLRPEGNIFPCCWLVNYPIGQIQTSSLEEIWNSEAMKKLRREFIEGKPLICAENIKLRGCNAYNPAYELDFEVKEVLDYPMKRLDVMLNGQCNLECIMCDIWKSPNGVYTEERFWKEAREKIFPYLKELNVKGGEPFIQKDVYKLINEVSEINKECDWFFTTNGHFSVNDTIFKLLDKIRVKYLSVSIDSLKPDIFAKIRKNGELEKTLKSLKAFKKYRDSLSSDKKFVLKCNFVIQQENYTELTNFIEFTESEEITPFFVMLTVPQTYSLLSLSEEKRKEILDYYTEEFRKKPVNYYLKAIYPLILSLNPEDRFSYILNIEEILNN